MPESKDAALESLVEDFDKELSASLLAFSGINPVFTYSRIGGDAVSVRLEQHENEPGIIPLKSRGHTVVGIQPEV